MILIAIIEHTSTGFGAHIPDLPGCIATGTTREQTVHRITEAARMHLRGMQEDGIPLPEPTSTAETALKQLLNTKEDGVPLVEPTTTAETLTIDI